ncbi:MAG: Gfo/Idh/MocA family oxidoreductase [Sedimentisphaerales bacterium]|nr:Gfo/Idh/MocA family oxidoreductase [Sedimentisphaerales bacterium]
MMNPQNRRTFLKNSIVSTAAAYLGLSSCRSYAADNPTDELRIAVAGIRGRGNQHIEDFQKIEGVKVVALCDPDKEILENRVKETVARYGHKVQGYVDVRRLLDRKDIDVLVIAAPNHWHSLMTVYACQAGKHVYVEKPVSHSIWEGRQMVRAARRYNRIVQAGTQQRSCPAVQEAAHDIQSGKYGKPQWVHCSRLVARASIGKVTEPQPVPGSVDYNLWAGPAPMTPVMRKSFHYDWHWQWPWGDGEMGNWGVHYVDDLRHLLGWDDVPTKVIAAGNRFAWDDNGETPNMHFALFYHEDLPVVVDIRNLPDPQRRGGSDGAVYRNSREGNRVEFEEVSLRLVRGGGGVYDANGRRIRQYKGDGGSAHVGNFIRAVRAGRREDLAAEIEVGHLSTAMCHLANIAFRVGRQTHIDQIRESMKSSEDAVNTLHDICEQLEGNNVDLTKTPLVLGPPLTYDNAAEKFFGAGAEEANHLLKCPHRAPFVMPETL